MHAGGGFNAIRYSLITAFKVGPVKFLYSIFSRNTCKTCALGMGGQQGGMKNELGQFPAICKKSIQAQLTDLQPEIQPDIFKNISINELRSYRGSELERLGRLNYLLYKKDGDTHFSVISWEEAFLKIPEKMKKTDPAQTFFYSSGRSSNEAAFLLQLFARLYGTNNINNCSYFCHQASGVGLNSVIGSGTATIQLYDLKGADCIFLIGANPASNHPRLIVELLECRRRGGHVIVENPAKELGLVRFAVPSDIRSMFSGGSEIASSYIQPNIGGDIAFLKGIAKYVLDRGKEDQYFIDAFTHNFDNYKNDILNTDWNEIVRSSGVSMEAVKGIGEIYANAKNTVFLWAMGVTHHIHGVDNVTSIANLALLRGMIGRKYAGLAPIRGHSNVQGIGSVGMTPALKERVFKNIEKNFNITLPSQPGLDTMSSMEAAYKGDIDFAMMLGGNLYGSNPDQSFASTAVNNIAFKVYLNTTLNLGHCNGTGNEMVILPVAARDEEKQNTTQESMFNFVRLSDGGIVRLDNVRSEVDIISEIASKVLGDTPIDFRSFKDHNNDPVRDRLEYPGIR